jgi:hypothetical protein
MRQIKIFTSTEGEEKIEKEVNEFAVKENAKILEVRYYIHWIRQPDFKPAICKLTLILTYDNREQNQSRGIDRDDSIDHDTGDDGDLPF